MASAVTIKKKIADFKLAHEESFFADQLIAAHCNVALTAKKLGWSLDKAKEMVELPVVKKRMDDLITANQVNATEVVSRIASVARGTMGDYINIDEQGQAEVNLLRARDEGKLGCIKALRVKRWKERHCDEWTTETQIELHDPMVALRNLSKIMGLEVSAHRVNVALMTDAQLIEMLKGKKDPRLDDPTLTIPAELFRSARQEADEEPEEYAAGDFEEDETDEA